MIRQAALLATLTAWLAGDPPRLAPPIRKPDFRAVMRIHRKRCSRKRRK